MNVGLWRCGAYWYG